MLPFTQRTGEETVIRGDLPVQLEAIDGKKVPTGGPSANSEPVAHHEPSEGKTARGAIVQGKAAQSHQSLDDELRRRIVNFLFERNLPGLRRLDVEVRDGEAVIIGFVRTYYEKQLATHCCQRVAGVLRVINDISVFQPSSVSPAPENPRSNAQPRPPETEKHFT